MRRIHAFLLGLVLLIGLVPAAATLAAPAQVTGTLSMKAKIALGPDAAAVITLVDQQADPSAGVVIGMQRLDGVTLPGPFAVDYDDAEIDPDHSYALFASVVDGDDEYQSAEPIPVITGGPTTDIAVNLVPRSEAATGAVTGTVTRDQGLALTPDAVEIVALINEDKGTLVARQVITDIEAEPIPFSIAYDPGIIDPAATYVVRAGIGDAEERWNTPEGVDAIVDGAVVSDIEVPVEKVPPAPTPEPTEAPTEAPTEPSSAEPTEEPTTSTEPTEAPTAAPTEAPTEAPTATPKPTAAPTEAPTAAPTEAPTATAAPTEAPSATPVESPSASPSPTATASPTPTPAPDSGIIRGTLTWNEGHEPTKDARAVVLLVEGTNGPSQGKTVTSVSIKDPGPKPIAFELSYPMASVTEGSPYRLYAGLADGDLAWVTPIGVSVDVPSPLIEGVELPLEFRPDLLKAAVGGTITGVGLDPTQSDDAYGTALLIKVTTGETLGFQLVSPAGAAPVPFSVPYDPTAIDPNADYVARGSMWDGTTLWAVDSGVPVITKDNARSGVVLTVTEAVTVSPSPSATVPPTAAASAAPAPTPAPAEPTRFDGLLIFVVLGLGGLGLIGLLVYLRSRQ